jgi:ABC-2 type transport system ATP-binding protein
MSSHVLAEVDRLATRIGIIHCGRLVEELDADALEQRRDQRLEIGARDLNLAEQHLRAAGFEPSWSDSGRHGMLLELRDPRALNTPEAIAELLVQGGARPTRVALERESLEEHFVRLTSAAEGASS